MDATACEFDQIAGSLHRRRQHTKHFVFESAQCRKPTIRRRREVDARAPDFVERADGGPRHSGKSLDHVELTQARTCQSGLNRLLEPLRIDGLQEPTREARGELSHGQHLHAVRALPRGVELGTSVQTVWYERQWCDALSISSPSTEHAVSCFSNISFARRALCCSNYAVAPVIFCQLVAFSCLRTNNGRWARVRFALRRSGEVHERH